MRGIRGLTIPSLLLMAPVAAMAQGSAVRQACGAEIQQHCAGVQPGEGRLRACVKEHFAAFSEPCKQAMLSSVAVVRACKADVQQTCPDIQPGGGRIQACMKDHFAEYSDTCKQAIITAKFGTR
jgi:Cysteine rich repeat